MSIILTCETSADLEWEEYQRLSVDYIATTTIINGEHIKGDPRIFDVRDMYRRMREGASVSTSQVNIGEYEEKFRGICKAGNDLLHVSMASGMSGSYAAACAAAEELRKEFPERIIEVTDGRMVSTGYGMIVEKLAEMRDQGASIQEMKEWNETHRLEMQSRLYIPNLKWVVAGGRVSRAIGIIGGAFGLCFVMCSDVNGYPKYVRKTRHKKAAIRELVQEAVELADGGLDYSGRMRIAHGDVLEDALALKEQVEQTFHHLSGEIKLTQIGPMIGAHTGPGTVSLFFRGKPGQRE